MPVWGWVLSALGTIAAGVGLGYLVIILFWKIEKILGPLTVVREEMPQPVEEEIPVEDTPEEIEDEELPVQEEPPVIEEEIPEEKEVFIEEATPIMDELLAGEDKKSIKFATVLKKKFNHPFRTVTTIVCWDIAVENGDEVFDSEGKALTFQSIEAQGENAKQWYFLVNEGRQKVISVVSGKNYIKRETSLDVDKVRRMNTVK